MTSELLSESARCLCLHMAKGRMEKGSDWPWGGQEGGGAQLGKSHICSMG